MGGADESLLAVGQKYRLENSSKKLGMKLWFLRVMNPEFSTLSLTDIRSGFSSLYFCPPASNDPSSSPNGLPVTTSVALASFSAS